MQIFDHIKLLAGVHGPTWFVIDATGVGEGLWALLDAAYPGKVIPVKFSAQKKSEIGWKFLAILNTGRLKDHAHTEQVRKQYAYAKSEIMPGPAKLMRWGVPDGARDPSTGEHVHDDYLLADSLTAELDLLLWAVPTKTLMLAAPDPLEDMDRAY